MENLIRFLSVLVIFSCDFDFLKFVNSKPPDKDQNEQTFTPRIQIRAILIRCPQHIIPDNKVRAGGTSNDDKVISVLRTDDIMRFSGFDKDELLMHSEVKNCKRKMIITMMINNSGRTVTEEEFVVVDHVYDPDLHKRSRLLNPLVFKIKQDAVLQLYGMRYLQSVNAMAREEVLNKGMNNFTGCDTTSSQPTCGMVLHNKRVVPFSEGFCCSCDSYVNVQRQPGLSIVRQQKQFSDRKESHFADEKNSNDADKYYHEKSKRDVNEPKDDKYLRKRKKEMENRDYSIKNSNNLDVLRSKYMASDFDFAKNGFYTPQIVRKSSLGDTLNKFSNPEDSLSWEQHKGRLYDKSSRILWNNDNANQMPNNSEEDEFEDGDSEGKKKRSADEEGGQSLHEERKKITKREEGEERKEEGHDEEGRELELNSEEKNRTDSNYESKEKLGERNENLQRIRRDEKDAGMEESEDMNLEIDKKGILDSIGRSGIDHNNYRMENRYGMLNTLNTEEGPEHRLNSYKKDIDNLYDLERGEEKLNVGDENTINENSEVEADPATDSDHLDGLNGVEKEIYDGDLKLKQVRSAHDEPESLMRSSLRVTEEKPYWLRPKDWTSLKALKLRLKGLKPNSPQFQNSYQPAHRYVKVLEENRPVMENAKGFQVSDFRPSWNPSSKIKFHKPSPWDIFPKKCATDKRKHSILRLLTKLNEERCHPDEDFKISDNLMKNSGQDSKLFDSLMKDIERKLVRNSRNNVNETEQSNLNHTESLGEESSKKLSKNDCAEAWSELQTLLLEEAIEENLCLHDRNRTSNESNIAYNTEDKNIIDRLRRQIGRWVDDYFEIDALNIHDNSSNKYMNGDDLVMPVNEGDYLYFVDPAQNLASSDGLLRYPYRNIGENEEVGGRNSQKFVFDDGQMFPGLDDLDAMSENDRNASSLYEFRQRNRNALGLLPGAGKIFNSDEDNFYGNSREQSKIDVKKNNNWKSAIDENLVLNYPDLPLKEKIDEKIHPEGSLVNDYDKNHMMINKEEENSGPNEFHLNPPLHFHSDSGPVFIDVTKYGPLLDTRPLEISKSSFNSFPLIHNDLDLINSPDFDKMRSAHSKFPIKLNSPEKSSPELSDSNLQDHRVITDGSGENSNRNFNNEETEHTGKISNSGSDNPNSKGKESSGLKHNSMFDRRDSYFIDNNSNTNRDESSLLINNNFNSNSTKLGGFKFGRDFDQNARNYPDPSNRLGGSGASNMYKFEDENSYKLTNNAMMFDDMPVPNNVSHMSRNDNLSHKSYHVYKQEIESPFIIDTSHDKHNPNFKVMNSNDNDIDDKRSHFLEVATEFGSPSILNTSDMQYLLQNAMDSGGTENSTSSVSKNAFKGEFDNTTPSDFQESFLFNTSKAAPILISGNVGNIYGQKGKLIFIPDDDDDDDSEEVTTRKQVPYRGNFIGNYNSRLFPPMSGSNMSYPGLMNSGGTCNVGKQGYGISHMGNDNINVKSRIFPSFLKNWSRNPDGSYLDTSHVKVSKIRSVSNTDNSQSNSVQRNNKLNYSSNEHITCDMKVLNELSSNEAEIHDNFVSPRQISTLDKSFNNVDSFSTVPKKILDKYGLKRDVSGMMEDEKIEKRDTEKVCESRLKKNSKKVRRQVSSNGNQIRGGQNCIDRYVPSGANPITYHESAHCLRFSELWYSVYTLKKPSLDHSLHLQLYEKANFPHATHWEELTRGITTDLGTGNRHIEDGYSTLSFTYIPLTDLMRGDFCLDEHRATLLVPESLPPDLAAKYPQLNGSPNEYLLVQSDDISLEGDECNKVGTSFEGFATQPDRCAQPRGTCLQNQPIDMWTHDIMARDEGRPGKFFLENYAIVAEQPLLMNHSSQEQSLALEYYRQFSTIIEIEVKSDLNAIVRTGESGQLSEIYVDSTCHSNTKLTVIVTNQGLASSAYYPKLSNCPVELPEVWTHNVGPLVMIAPQHRHVFQMTMYGELPVDRFHCSVELMNDKKELVATRRVRIQKHDRCVCVWHCLCACTASTDGLSCDVMSLPHYHAAGFLGSLPLVNLHPETQAERVIRIAMPVFIVIGFSLIIGLFKAIIGLCVAVVGSYGLWAVCKNTSKNLSAYKEDDLKDFDVEHDVQSFAVHPESHTRNIKLFNKLSEFILNIFFVFLLIWEFILFILCCGCLSEEDEEDDDDEDDESDETSELDDDDSSTSSNELEDESVTVNSVIEERRRCVEDVKGYNVDVSNQCLIFVGKNEDKLNKTQT